MRLKQCSRSVQGALSNGLGKKQLPNFRRNKIQLRLKGQGNIARGFDITLFPLV